MKCLRNMLGDDGGASVWARLLAAAKRLGLIAFVVSVVIGRVHAGDGGGQEEESYQVPVVEGVERPDSPAADAASGDAEADLPAVKGVPGAQAPPAAEHPEGVEQPPVEP